MDINTAKAVTAIVTKKYCKNPDNMGKITSSIYINQFQSIMNQNKISLQELKEFREDFTELFEDLCYLRANDIIKTQHVKDLLEYGWNHPYFDLCTYLIDKKILDVVEENVLISMIKKHLEENPKIVEQVKNGKPQVAGSIIGKLKKDLGNKFNPSEAMELIQSEIQNM